MERAEGEQQLSRRLWSRKNSCGGHRLRSNRPNCRDRLFERRVNHSGRALVIRRQLTGKLEGKNDLDNTPAPTPDRPRSPRRTRRHDMPNNGGEDDVLKMNFACRQVRIELISLSSSLPLSRWLRHQS